MDDLREIGRSPDATQERENEIKGIKKFFGEKEAKLFADWGREITEQTLQESFLLYRIDLEKTKVHPLYGEAKIKRWLPAIEIFGRINVETLEPTYQVKGGILKKGFGLVTASVYVEHLEELGLVNRKSNNELVFGYKMGDFMEFKGQTFEIVDDGFSQIGNKYSWGGDRRFYVTIKGRETDEDIFKGR